MSKKNIKAFSTEEEVIEAVRKLIDQGHLSGDLTIVTNRENRSNIQERVSVEVDKVSVDGELTPWEKIKNMFSDVDEEAALEHYGVDNITAIKYNEAIKQGHFVLLVEEDGMIESGLSADSDKPLSTAFDRAEKQEPIGQGGQGTIEIKDTSGLESSSAHPNSGDERLNNAEAPANKDQITSDDEPVNKPSDSDSGSGKGVSDGDTIGQLGQGNLEIKDTSEPSGGKTSPNDGDDRLNNAEIPADETRSLTESEESESVISVSGLPEKGSEDDTDSEPVVPRTLEEDERMLEENRQAGKPRLQDNQRDDVTESKEHDDH